MTDYSDSLRTNTGYPARPCGCSLVYTRAQHEQRFEDGVCPASRAAISREQVQATPALATPGSVGCVCQQDGKPDTFCNWREACAANEAASVEGFPAGRPERDRYYIYGYRAGLANAFETADRVLRSITGTVNPNDHTETWEAGATAFHRNLTNELTRRHTVPKQSTMSASMSHLYRKKPVVIEAVQFTGSNGAWIAGWAAEHGGDIDGTKYPTLILIHTLEGVMEAHVGDWIIKGIEDEFYPCAPSIFDASYEAVA